MNVKNYTRQNFVIRMIFFLTYAAGAAWLSYFNLFLRQYIGLTDGQIGIISAVQQINTLLLLPFWGMIADRFGRKKILALNMILVIILFYGFIFQDTFISVLAFTYLFTLFYSPIVSLVDSIALDYIEQTGKSSYGSIRLWASIGWAVSSIITGYFVRPEKIYLIFPIASSILLLNWLILKLIYHPLKFIKNLQSLKMKHVGEIILKDKRLAIILIIMFFYGIFSAPIHLFINVYYAEIGAAYYHVGYAYAIQALSEVPFFFFGKKIIKWTGSRRIIVFTMLITSLRMFAYGIIANPWIAISIGIIHGISLALFLVAFISYVHQFIPPQWRATGQSFVYAFYFGGGMAFGNLWTGFVADHIGMSGAMIVEATLTLVLVLITLFVFGTIRRISDRIEMKFNDSNKSVTCQQKNGQNRHE